MRFIHTYQIAQMVSETQHFLAGLGNLPYEVGFHYVLKYGGMLGSRSIWNIYEGSQFRSTQPTGLLRARLETSPTN